MKPLLRIIFSLALVFASTFILVRLTGIFSIKDIELWLEKATQVNSMYVGIVIILLLSIDIFIAIPTLASSILAGYFLGPLWGGLTATSGMLLAGVIGYTISYKYGESLLTFIISSEEKRNEAIKTFNVYGLPMILLSRCSPIFPEVCACMAGMTRMKFKTFILAWLLNTIPYAFIAAYSGSISSINNTKPAIYTAIMMYALLWLGWFLYKRNKRFKTK